MQQNSRRRERVPTQQFAISDLRAGELEASRFLIALSDLRGLTADDIKNARTRGVRYCEMARRIDSSIGRSA